MIILKLNACIRSIKGKNSSKKLKLLNLIPAIIYGKNINNNILIELNYFEFNNFYIKNKKIFFNNAKNIYIELNLNNNFMLVKIKKIQFHCYKYYFIHIDFIKV